MGGTAVAVRVRRGLAVALVSLVALALAAGPAAAHAAFVGSIPGDGSVLGEAPAAVRISFDAAITPVGPGLRVHRLDGERVDLGPFETGSPASVAVRLPDGLEDGGYVATYRVASADGHVLTGVVTFRVAVGGGPAVDGGTVSDDAVAAVEALAVPTGPTRAESVVRAIASVLRTVTYLTALTAVGSVLFSTVVARDPELRRITRRPVRPAAIATVVATLVALPVQALVLVGLDRIPLVDVVRSLAAVPSSGAVVMRLVGALVLVLVARGPVVGAGAALVLSSFVLDGHQFDAEPNELLRLADTVHLVTASLWLGGVVALALVFAARSRDPATVPTSGAAALVVRFSGIAVASVALTAMSGTAMVGILVRDPRAVLPTAYGRALVAKLVFVALVLAVAAYNRRRMLPLLAAGEGTEDEAAWARLVTTVRAEAAMLLGVLAVTGVLVAQTPPVAPVGPVGYAGEAVLRPDVRVGLVVDPSRVGANVVGIHATERSGAPSLAVREVRIDATPVDGGSTVVLPAVPTGPGRWEAPTDAFDRYGTWRVRVVVTLVDGSEVGGVLLVPIAPGVAGAG